MPGAARRRWLGGGATGLVALLFASIGLAVDRSAWPALASAPPALTTFTWSTTVAPGTTIALANAHGDIHVRPASERFVGLTLAVQCATDERPLNVAATEATIRLEVAADACARVDATLHVGPGLPLRLATGSGSIDARRTQNPIVARSVSGDLSFVGDGPVAAESQTGTTRLTPVRPKWRHPHAVRTASGAIHAVLPLTDVTVRACTEGSIALASGLEALATRRAGPCLTASEGTGGAHLELRSDSGSITLYPHARWEAAAGKPNDSSDQAGDIDRVSDRASHAPRRRARQG